MTIKAVFENGVFRPTEAVSLPEGTAAEVVVHPAVQTRQPRDAKAVAKSLAEIAALADPALEPHDGLSGSRDHDEILYGGKRNDE